MRSLIIIEVEHGNTTDELQAFADYISDPQTDHKVTVRDYAVEVDIPSVLTAENVGVALRTEHHPLTY